jgi:hypothetical protein
MTELAELRQEAEQKVIDAAGNWALGASCFGYHHDHTEKCRQAFMDALSELVSSVRVLTVLEIPL